MHPLLIRLGLRFDDPHEERVFVRRFTLDDLARTQAAMLLGALAYSSFVFWDLFLRPESWQTATLIRLAVAVLVLLPAALLLHRQDAQRWAEAIYFVYGLVPGCMLSVVYVFLRPSFDHGAAGVIVVILFVAIILPLRVPAFAVFCILTWMFFLLYETLSPQETPGIRFVNNFEIGVAYALSLYGVGAREYRARRQFRTAHALHAEKDRSEAMLTELRATQARLVQSEKLASLGQLVAGVAHEINTPIGVAMTTATAFEADIRQIGRGVETGQLRRSELTGGLDRLSEGSRILFVNLNRAADLVQGFKQVAVDRATEAKREFRVGEWLHEVLTSLGPLIRRRGHGVEARCPDDLTIETYPGALAQVVSNLAMNAVIHAFADRAAGRMVIDVSRDGDRGIRIVFEDDGSGIAPEHVGKVFDPFFTTRRAEGGTGLGLHIVYNLVTGVLGGEVRLSSEFGRGTRFCIDLPFSVADAVPPRAAVPA